MSNSKKTVDCMMLIVKFFTFMSIITIVSAIMPSLIPVLFFIAFIGFIWFIVAMIKLFSCRETPVKGSLKSVNFDNMSGQKFEKFCAKVLRLNGFTKVKVTKGSGDRGVDILATKNGVKYAIQCKRHSRNIGNKAVQEIYSGRAIYHADVAVVMTNRYFTKQAEEDARVLKVQLWGRNKLKKLIRLADDEIVNEDNS